MTSIHTNIAAVTVYVDRARVTRRGVVALEAGEQTITLSELPDQLIEDSVRASGRGAGVRILGVDVATEFVAHPPEENIAALQQQLEALQDEDKALADAETASEARRGFLSTLRESSGHSLAKSLAYGNAALERVQALAEYLDRELDAVQARDRELAQKRREQKRQIDAVQARLNRLQNIPSNRRREIRVAVEASAATDLELEITFMVHAASWKPLYDVRLDGNKVGLSYLASVSQRSGEDWPAVELSLSTAHPAVSTEIPELEPWFIDAERPVAKQAFRATPAGAAAIGAPAPFPARMLEEAAAPAEAATAVIETSGAAVTYRVARPVAVPSDGAPHKTTVTALDLAAQLDYVTAPKLAQEAYLRAKIKNVSPFILLPGRANIFHGADFVGTTDLETIAPNEEFEAHLGVDDRIKVERELVERTVDKTLIGNTRRTLFRYKMVLTNLLTAPARITVFDQLPVSRHEEIKVKLREASPKPMEQDDLNILEWDLELKPQEKREVTFEFLLEHPREMRLVGLGE